MTQQPFWYYEYLCSVSSSYQWSFSLFFSFLDLRSTPVMCLSVLVALVFRVCGKLHWGVSVHSPCCFFSSSSCLPDGNELWEGSGWWLWWLACVSAALTFDPGILASSLLWCGAWAESCKKGRVRLGGPIRCRLDLSAKSDGADSTITGPWALKD